MLLVATKGVRKLLKYFPGFMSFMCVICVDISHCVTTNQENRMRLCCGLCYSSESESGRNRGNGLKGKRRRYKRREGGRGNERES